MRRRSIQLLEFLIALIIMGFVLEMLFLGYRHALVGKEKVQIEKEIILGKQRLLLKLEQLFRSVKKVEEIPKKGFVLNYNGSRDPDRDFRGLLEGYLYVDRGCLILISWSEDGQSRMEALYEAVQSIQLEFFDSHSGTFKPSFPATKPLMMKASLTLANQELLELPIFL